MCGKKENRGGRSRAQVVKRKKGGVSNGWDGKKKKEKNEEKTK